MDQLLWQERPATNSESTQLLVYSTQKALLEWDKSTGQDGLLEKLWVHAGESLPEFRVMKSLAKALMEAGNGS